MQAVDDEFYERADAHIHLSNDQVNEKATIGKVSASNMYATARFNAWVSACGWNDGKEMAKARRHPTQKAIKRQIDDTLKRTTRHPPQIRRRRSEGDFVCTERRSLTHALPGARRALFGDLLIPMFLTV